MGRIKARQNSERVSFPLRTWKEGRGNMAELRSITPNTYIPVLFTLAQVSLAFASQTLTVWLVLFNSMKPECLWNRSSSNVMVPLVTYILRFWVTMNVSNKGAHVPASKEMPLFARWAIRDPGSVACSKHVSMTRAGSEKIPRIPFLNFRLEFSMCEHKIIVACFPSSHLSSLLPPRPMIMSYSIPHELTPNIQGVNLSWYNFFE